MNASSPGGPIQLPWQKRWTPKVQFTIAVDVASGYVKIAIENGHWNSGFTH